MRQALVYHLSCFTVSFSTLECKLHEDRVLISLVYFQTLFPRTPTVNIYLIECVLKFETPVIHHSFILH